MSEKITAMIEEIKNLTVLELADLVHALEDTFGVSAAAVAAPAAGGAAAPAAEEKTEFDVVMTDFGAEKIKVIKEVRGKGLMPGAELTHDDIGRDIVNDVLANGAIINCTAGNVLRFVPPLIITEADIDAVIACVDKALAKFA